MLEQWRFASTDVSAMQAARADFMRVLRAQGEPSGDYDACELAFGELVANAIQHAPPGDVRVDVRWNDEHPKLSVTDRGAGFKPKSVELPPADRSGGRGLYIVATLSGTFTVERLQPTGCEVSVTLPVRRRAPFNSRR